MIREDLHISYTQAGMLSAAAMLSYAMGQIPAGFLAGRIGPRRLFVIAFASVFLQIYFGPLFFIPVEVVGPRAAGTAIGFSNLFANMGGLATAFALGAVKDMTGSFKWGFLGISGLCVVGALLSVALAHARQHMLDKQPANN